MLMNSADERRYQQYDSCLTLRLEHQLLTLTLTVYEVVAEGFKSQFTGFS